MANPVAAWHTERVYFGRLLDLLQKQVDVFRSGERPNYEAMFDIIEYLRHYTDRVHHPREDAAFAFLARRRPGMQLELEHLSQEHRVLAQAGEMLLKYLNEIVEGAIVPRAEVEATAATYVLYYRNHIATEEKEVLARASHILTAEDWVAVAAAAPAGDDPLFGASPAERYKQLRLQISLQP